MGEKKIYFLLLAIIVAFLFVVNGHGDHESAYSIRVLKVGMDYSETKEENLSNFSNAKLGSKSLNKSVNQSNIAPKMGTKTAFNISQNTVTKAVYKYNTNYNKRLFNQSEYSSSRPFYSIPSFIKPKQMYDVTNYPLIKAPNSIP